MSVGFYILMFLIITLGNVAGYAIIAVFVRPQLRAWKLRMNKDKQKRLRFLNAYSGYDEDDDQPGMYDEDEEPLPGKKKKVRANFFSGEIP